MKTALLAIFNWLHLLAAIIWVGGIIFILFVAIPSSKLLPSHEAAKVMGNISKRFTPLANYSIMVLVITGIFSSLSLSSIQTISFILKLVLAFSMIAIHFYRGLLLGPKIAIAEPANKAKLQKFSLNLVRANLVLGLVIILFSVLI